jgi:hypothetical protein
VWGIFGDNLLQRKEITKVFLSLIGAGNEPIKSFECVGTYEECRAAVELTLYQYLKYSKSLGIHLQNREVGGCRSSDKFDWCPAVLNTLCEEIKISLEELESKFINISEIENQQAIMDKYLLK